MAFLVYMTASSEAEAERIAEELVTDGLAAGVNIVPGIRSVYRWKGEIRHEAEVVLFAQTEACCFEQLKRRVCELHSYETPCIVAVSLDSGDAAFLQWIKDSTSPALCVESQD